MTTSNAATAPARQWRIFPELSGTAIAGVAIAIFLLAFLILPVLKVTYVAFQDPHTGALTLQNFGDFFRSSLFRSSFVNSFYVSAMSVVVATVIALPLAYITTRFNFGGSALIQSIGVIPLIMPPFVGAIAMQLLFGRNGTVNLLLSQYLGFKIPFMEGLNGVIFVQSLHYFPFILINLSASLRNIDKAMEESAQNLGCTGLRLFRRIVFPLAMPGYIAGAALVFIKVFDDLGTPLLLNVNNMLAPRPICAFPPSASAIRWATSFPSSWWPSRSFRCGRPSCSCGARITQRFKRAVAALRGATRRAARRSLPMASSSSSCFWSCRRISV